LATRPIVKQSADGKIKVILNAHVRLKIIIIIIMMIIIKYNNNNNNNNNNNDDK